MYILTAVETSQIQSYVFNSNRLKENVGASYLVSAATDNWVSDIVQSLGLSHNLNDLGFTQQTIEHDALDIEVLYCGGGNAVILFREESHAKDFANILSLRALIEAPRLQLTLHQQPMDWDTEPLSHAVSDALRQLKIQRSKQPSQAGLAGLAVTSMCTSTSWPATTVDCDPDGNWQAFSAEVAVKRDAVQAANNLLNGLISEVEEQLQEEKLQSPFGIDHFRFALELDDLGRAEGESSFIAVAHIDGNDIGKLIQQVKANYPTAQYNREYIENMRDFSENIKRVSHEALVAMLVLLVKSLQKVDGKYFIHGIHNQAAIQLVKRDDLIILPFRPLISGGDDITFVCDGRIGLDMAIRFMEAFEEKTQKYLGQTLTACAGVAIVNAHYPFARAYELAEELCQSAKQERHKSHQQGSSFIDWHYTSGGLYDNLDGMRKREYQIEGIGWLNLRPLVATGNANSYHSWAQIQGIATEFQTKWRDHHSKAKNLMDTMRLGEAAVQTFLKRYIDGEGIMLPRIVGIPPDQTWINNSCLYYDALELIDLYIPITEGRK